MTKKHIRTGLMAAMMLISMSVFLLAGCSDDDVVKTPLQETRITEGAKTVSTLNFMW